MKILLVITFGLLLGFNCLAQVERTQNLLKKVGIEEIYLAKDNGEGKAGDPVENFLVSDVPIHCVVLLDSVKPATVKMNFIAVNVKGVKTETKVFSVSYTTSGKQNQVSFTGKPGGKAWIAGNYRIDVFVDGKLTGNKAFTIEKPLVQTDAQTNFVTSKPKTTKRTRKN